MNYSTNWIYGKNIWKPKALEWTWERPKLGSVAKTCTHWKTQEKNPCGVCLKGVGSNSIFCDGCQSWIHKKCSGFKGKLKADPKYRCKRCMGLCWPVDGRPEKHVTLEGIQLDVVESFHYLGDKISPGSGCELAKIAWTRAAWGEFRELVPLLTSTTISLARHGKLYDSCVRGILLHATECWPLRREEVQYLLLKIKAEDSGEPVINGQAIESCTFEIKDEVKLPNMVWTCEKEW